MIRGAASLGIVKPARPSNGADQMVGIEGLGQLGEGIQRVDAWLVRDGGQHDDWDVCNHRVGELPPAEFLTAASRHHDVEDDRAGEPRVLRAELVEPLEPFEAIAGFDHADAVHLEDELDDLARITVVFDDEDVRVADGGGHAIGCAGRRRPVQWPRQTCQSDGARSITGRHNSVARRLARSDSCTDHRAVVTSGASSVCAGIGRPELFTRRHPVQHLNTVGPTDRRIPAVQRNDRAVARALLEQRSDRCTSRVPSGGLTENVRD
jgi:hypothetical protein